MHRIATYVFIAVGGAAGAAVRWAVDEALGNDGFPWATLLVNVVGAALLAFEATRTGSSWRFSRGVCGVIEMFWGPMQPELLNRKRWNTRVEFAAAMFEYVEIFHTGNDAIARSGCSPLPSMRTCTKPNPHDRSQQTDCTELGAHQSSHTTRGASCSPWRALVGTHRASRR